MRGTEGQGAKLGWTAQQQQNIKQFAMEIDRVGRGRVCPVGSKGHTGVTYCGGTQGSAKCTNDARLPWLFSGGKTVR